MKLLSIIMVFVSCTISAHECSKIEDSLKRLNCFDNYFPANDAEIKQNIDSTNKSKFSEIKEDGDEIIGDWLIKNYTDEMDGSKTWQAINIDIDQYNQPVSLILGCARNEPLIGLIYSHYMGLSGRSNKLVEYKYDESEVISESWTVFTKAGIKRNESAKNNVKFLQKMKTSGELMIRARPYSKNQITSTFYLSGSEKVLQKIKEECPRKDRYWK